MLRRLSSPSSDKRGPFVDVFSGLIAGAFVLSFTLSLAALIFSGPVKQYLPSGIGALHFLSHTGDSTRVHRIVGQCLLLDQPFEMGTINSMLDDLGQLCAHVWQIAVTNSLDQEIAQ